MLLDTNSCVNLASLLGSDSTDLLNISHPLLTARDLEQTLMDTNTATLAVYNMSAIGGPPDRVCIIHRKTDTQFCKQHTLSDRQANFLLLWFTPSCHFRPKVKTVLSKGIL